MTKHEHLESISDTLKSGYANSLKVWFAVGNQINAAVAAGVYKQINSCCTETSIAMDAAGHEHYAPYWYHDAYYAVQTLSAAQQGILAKRKMRVHTCRKMLQRYKDAGLRQVINEIRDGEIEWPFREIGGTRTKRAETLAHELGAQDGSPHTITLPVYDPDGMLIALESLMSQVNQDDLCATLNQAVDNRRKSGLKLRKFRLEG